MTMSPYTSSQVEKSMIVTVLIYVAAISVSAWFLLPRAWYVWIGIISFGFIVVVRRHNQLFVYQCTSCNATFKISMIQNLISPHGLSRDGAGWTYLTCPVCGTRMRARVLPRTEDMTEHAPGMGW
jgi:hypothetical protein